ncbi:hypothetical protein CHISP_2013 [Chitinispirillum alkaliphilum]|nr:hypothetical protein CHISP_2013 [Chitinispirillum alkaliphilum]
MFHNASSLTGMSLDAQDGHIGKIDDIYFDDQNWAVRYVVADIGFWLLGRKVLLSPAALHEPKGRSVTVNATKEQVKKSPDINTAEPVSRKLEEELHDHYSWPYYWVYPQHYNSLGAAIYPGLSYPSGFPQPTQKEPFTAKALEKEKKTEEKMGQWSIRSAKEVDGYHIQCTDEEIGHVEDFIIDTTNWVVRYLIVNTKNILPGKKVILAPQWVLGIDWAETKVFVDVSAETIVNGPQFEPQTQLDRDFEERLYDYYKRPKYWKKKKK